MGRAKNDWKAKKADLYDGHNRKPRDHRKAIVHRWYRRKERRILRSRRDG